MPNKTQFSTHEEYLNWYRQYRRKHIIRFRKYNRRYNKEWREQFGYHNELNWKLRNPLKVRVEKILQKAVKCGTIKRLPCVVCGKKHAVAHHPDYNLSLNVEWLCPIHHAEKHRKIS